MIAATEPSVATLRRDDGRDLAWIETGDPQGKPVLYCHGFPSTGREALFAADAARACGLRLIAPDRPGYGDSTAQPGRRLIDWPREATALLDHLGVDRVPVIGLSGGCPYALACLALEPERFCRGLTVGGLGPLADEEQSRSMNGLSRVSIALARRRSVLQSVLFSSLALIIRYQPQGMFPLLAAGAPPADREILEQPALRATWQAAGRNAMRQGPRAAIEELRLYVQPWPFQPADIHTPVTLWHGMADSVVPATHARLLSEILPRNTLHLEAGHGHYSLPMTRIGAMLDALTKATG